MQRIAMGRLPRRGAGPRAPEYLAALHTKVVEEARELQDASPDERVDELADLLEVTTALIAALGITEAEVKQAADRKRATRGGIERRIWLEHVELGGASDA
nr:nucleoside triphosphate pyrophosphohydrolase [Rhodococcus koreensis]